MAEQSVDLDRLARQVDEPQARLRETAEATESVHAEAAAATRLARAANERLRTLALIQAMRHSGRFETALVMV